MTLAIAKTMLEFTFTAVVLTLGTWALVDIYLYNALLQRVRHLAVLWEQSPVRWKAMLGYGLQCPYCLGHWVAAGLVLAVLMLPSSLGQTISVLDAIFLVLIAARVSTMLRENVLRPITADLLADQSQDISSES